ncbi:type 2 periplasmic-binding domain-containing protein [Roseobacter sinensis]|uniref:Uncharacterized protein n=1 Tax=Roseobacter sinensis TaxID=2931391 RepID=A0ABT3BKV7_9RHOB|nr:hypothetical protein [Roseobacter sp. WL0113]
MIIKATGWIMGRDTELGLQVSLPYVFGGTQLMVHGALEIPDAKDLDAGTICVEAGTTIERISANYLSTLRVEQTMVSCESAAGLRAAYVANHCDAFACRGPEPRGAARHRDRGNTWHLECPGPCASNIAA